MIRLSKLYDDPRVRATLKAAEQADMERVGRLTRQQRVVMALICDGLLNKQAAGALGLSQRTIENHRLEIMSRLECKTIPELVRLHMRTSGFLELNDDQHF